MRPKQTLALCAAASSRRPKADIQFLTPDLTRQADSRADLRELSYTHENLADTLVYVCKGDQQYGRLHASPGDTCNYQRHFRDQTLLD